MANCYIQYTLTVLSMLYKVVQVDVNVQSKHTAGYLVVLTVCVFTGEFPWATCCQDNAFQPSCQQRQDYIHFSKGAQSKLTLCQLFTGNLMEQVILYLKRLNHPV